MSTPDEPRAPIAIYVDADACPVKAEAYRVAERHRVRVFVVANSFMQVPRDPLVERVVDETASHFGRLDGLVNNAGGMLGRVAYADLGDDQYDAVMNLNVRSVLTASRRALPWLKKTRGFIVNTSSIAARNGGSAGSGLYASAKAFVSNATRGLAKEFTGFGIRVNAVAPGIILTPFHERYSTDAQISAAVATIPQGRAGTADECVGAYLFLSSDMLSGYVTGQVIEVNGGQLMP